METSHSWPALYVLLRPHAFIHLMHLEVSRCAARSGLLRSQLRHSPSPVLNRQFGGEENQQVCQSLLFGSDLVTCYAELLSRSSRFVRLQVWSLRWNIRSSDAAHGMGRMGTNIVLKAMHNVLHFLHDEMDIRLVCFFG